MFADRVDAGRRLATQLGALAGSDVVVVGLPRGGVPVAAEVAAALGAPLDVILVRKLGVPRQPELAMGAIGEGGIRVVDPRVVGLAGVTERDLQAVEARERAELDRRAVRVRGAHPRLDLTGRTVIVVDDGVATGSTARAACEVARAAGAARVVLAAPVGPNDLVDRLRGAADDVVLCETPEPYHAVGQAYASFAQVSDDEVLDLLATAPARRDRPGAPG